MEWLNYHHLFYFWTVAHEGSVVAAARKLRLAQPTVSEQIKTLEESLGERLFLRTGKRLELTETGQLVLKYADEIFGLGRELLAVVQGRPSVRPAKLHVGVSDLVPKLVLHRLIEPALRMEPRFRVICREDKTDRLLTTLATGELDLVLAEVPLTSQSRVRAYNHLLGECGITFFGARKLTSRRKRRSFPEMLDGAPVLLPTENTLLRRDLDAFFERAGVQPQIVAEFEDSGLLKAFGQHGEGFFPSPTAMAREIRAQYGVDEIGRTEEVRERFYAITVERRIQHPAVLAISEAARDRLFATT